ncbi:hypothetical protein D3C87_1279060 [compost metagenome]
MGLARVDLVGGPVIDAGVVVAGCASSVAVAADLHVPEQGLAQQDRCRAIEHVIGHQVDLAPAFGTGRVRRHHAA